MWATIGKILATLIGSKTGLGGENVSLVGDTMGKKLGSWAKAAYSGLNSARGAASQNV